MRKSTTHLKDVSRFLSTPVDSGKSSVIPTTCRRNSHLSALLNAFPLEKQQQRLIPNNRRSALIRTLSTSTATIENLPTALPPVTTSFKKNVITPTTTITASRLQGSLSLFNLSDTVVLADLDHAIQTRNADKAWSLFITLASKQDDTIPFNMCCSLYSLLNFCKRLAGGAKQATKFRQRQLDQLLDYVQQNNSSLLFLSSIQEIPISSHKQLLRAIRVEDQKEAWHLFYRLHKASGTIDKLPRSTCIKLMVFIMKDRTLDKNQLKSRLQLIALHGAGTSEFDSRYMSAADVLRIANICHGYEKSEAFAHSLIDEFVVGIFKKKQSIRADALDELIWRILVNQDISKAHKVLDIVQTQYADKVDVNEMVFVNLMNAYRRQKNYHESLKLFEKLLEEKNTRPTIKAFNAVLQIFAVQGSADRASYIFETMNHLGVIPDISSYTELIRANAHNLKTCIYYYNKMRQNELKPNVYTFSALIEASSRRNDIKSVLEWFQTMLDENVQPNQVVISCILKSLSKQHNEYPNMPEAVIQIAHQAAMAGIKTDAALYTILLKMQAESIGIEGALKIHRDMLAQSVEPNAYTYTILINACGKFRMPETAEKIFDLMKNSTRHQPNTVTYTVLMDAWSIADRRDKVEGLISEFLKECKSDKSGRLWLDARIRQRLKSSCC